MNSKLGLSLVLFINIQIIFAQYNTITLTSELCNQANYQNCKTEEARKYRTLLGDCNNNIRPWLGKALSPMKRFAGFSSSYADNSGTPRSLSVNGRPLPSSRRVANAVLYPSDEFSKVNIFHVIYGQMVSHDLANSPQPQDASGRNMPCFCNDTANPLCIVLPTLPEDRINQDQSCMSTPRTISSNLNWNCRTSFREQVNRLTAWLDQSHIYGNNIVAANKLRRKDDTGYLASNQLPGFTREVFPFGQSGANQCLRDTVSTPCFQSGEGRTNENTGLTAVQVLFLRLHNLVAKKFQDLNGWSNQTLYQEAKRVATAFYLHILYNEWLEIIIGPDMMKQFGLYPLKSGYFYGYSATIVPQIQNEFTTAAFRYGHGMVPSQFFKTDQNFNNYKVLNLSDITFTPTEAYTDGGLDALCRGQIKNPGLNADSHFGDALHNHLFDVGVLIGNTRRSSLTVLNIERGRDHGLKSYNSYRSTVGLNEAKTWNDLRSNMQPEVIAELQSVYADVNDIDLFVGGLCENLLPGALVGQTFAYMMAHQFDELKRGDRFYYENDLTPTGFTEPQLNEIRKYTIARLICDTLDVPSIQKNPFLVSDDISNPMLQCNDIPNIDYSVFSIVQ